MKTIRPRDFTNVVDMPEHPYERAAMLRQLLGPHRLVMLVGMPCVGKTTLLEEYEHPDKHLTKWSRQPIFDMLFAGGERDEKYNSYISTFEAEMFPSLFQREYQQVVVDGWNKVRAARAHYLGLLPKGSGTSLAVVLDGPQELILERMKKDPRYSYRTDADLEDWVNHMEESAVWPSRKEGFDEIVYVNTFGPQGIEYLKKHVIARKQ